MAITEKVFDKFLYERENMLYVARSCQGKNPRWPEAMFGPIEEANGNTNEYDSLLTLMEHA